MINQERWNKAWVEAQYEDEKETFRYCSNCGEVFNEQELSIAETGELLCDDCWDSYFMEDVVHP